MLYEDHESSKIVQSKKEDKDQESIQSSTPPDPGYQWESDNVTIRHHKREMFEYLCNYIDIDEHILADQNVEQMTMLREGCLAYLLENYLSIYNESLNK